MPGLVRFGWFRSEHSTPQVSVQIAAICLSLAPVAVLELHAGRVATGVAAPFLLRQAALHLAGAERDEIALADFDVLILGAVASSSLPMPSPSLSQFDAAVPRDSSNTPRPTHLASGVLDAAHGEAARVDELRIVAVYGPCPRIRCAERIPVRAPWTQD